MSKTIKNRKANRLKNYDYSRQGYYFVTICTQNKECFFGEIENQKMILNSYGKIINQQWQWLQNQYQYVKLDKYIVMPDHFHGILIINDDIVKNNENNMTDVGTSRDLSLRSSLPHSLLQNSSSRQLPLRNLPSQNSPLHKRQHENIKIKSLSQLIGAFKTTSSKMIHQNGLENFSWQRSFHDHIIRDKKSLNNIRQYIIKNPMKWETDKNNFFK